MVYVDGQIIVVRVAIKNSAGWYISFKQSASNCYVVSIGDIGEENAAACAIVI